MGALQVVEPGMSTTVQDLGRDGYRRWGLPAAGALDRAALRIGNRLVGNPEGAAGLEATLTGPRLLARTDLVAAVTGAPMGLRVNGRPTPMWESIVVFQGSELALGASRGADGCRTYLTVAGGISVPEVLGSRSTFVRAELGGVQGRALKKGDILKVGDPVREATWGSRVPEGLRPIYRTLPVRVVPGPQHRAFSRRALATFFALEYRVRSDSDRMGLRLDGPPMESRDGFDIVSDAMLPGSIQVAPDGSPIVMLADGPTTGGYAKVGTVITADLDQLAQAAPGSRIRFRPVSIRQGQSMWAAKRRWLRGVIDALDERPSVRTAAGYAGLYQVVWEGEAG